MQNLETEVVSKNETAHQLETLLSENEMLQDKLSHVEQEMKRKVRMHKKTSPWNLAPNSRHHAPACLKLFICMFSFGGYFVQCVYTRVHLVCPLLGGFRVSFNMEVLLLFAGVPGYNKPASV